MSWNPRNPENPLNQPIDKARFAVVDVETTGLYPTIDRVVEVAVVVTDRWGNVQREFESLVNPNRDVGPTSIHGITAGMVAQAPTFGDVAGELLAMLSDSIWVGHNVDFDLRFLRAEFTRLNFDLPQVPSICTMRMFAHLGPSVESHKLGQVCTACGVKHHDAHSALGDAEATSMVLAHLLSESDDFEVSKLLDLAPYGLTGVDGKTVDFASDPFPSNGKSVSRKQAGDAERKSKSTYVGDLVRKLRPSTEADISCGSLGLYLNLLDRVLEDRQVDAQEGDDLFRLAQEWNLSQGDVCLAHKTYLGMMVGTALEDRVITDAEMNDLRAISNLLAIPDDELAEMIETSEAHYSATVDPTPPALSDFTGASVCFTGQTPGPSGEPIPRTEASELAESCGLTVLKNVTKKLDVLVVADPDTQSGKARKARAYGTRIVAASVFWRKIGIN